MPARISLHKLSALALLFGVVAVAVLLTAQSAEAATTKVEAGRLYMLELINQARQEAGVEPVVLGDSPVAQDHADAMLSDCFVAHWGLDGLKPYMRYSIAGGYQTNAENLVGLDYCVTASDGYSPIEGVREKVREHMEILMDSEGHRAAILYPWYKKVSIGLAWDTYNFWTAQLFEGDYVVYEHLPSLSHGRLDLAGAVKNGVTFKDPRELDVVIFYDPTPHALTRGQVARTYCYDAGRPIASLRTPAGLEFHYTEDEYETSYTPCPNPYDVPVDAPAPETHDEALEVFQNAYDAAQSAEEQSITVQWITAPNWKAEAEEFAVTVDIRDLLAEHGEGVYSVVLWGYIGDEPVLLSEYSVFYASTGSAVGDRYDANHNGVIDGPDVIQAVRDYFANIISGPKVIEVVRLYFAGRS